jgi:enterochelin esterase-like enzyme
VIPLYAKEAAMPTFPLLALARTMGNPVIETDTATFLWKGKTAPRLIDDLHNWEESPQEMTRVLPDLWTYELKLPEDAYLEYAYLDTETGQRIPDPYNPNKVWNGINAYNHTFYMPKGQPTELIKPGKGIARGTVTRHEVPTREMVVGKKRTVYLYQPTVKQPVPLLVVYDGTDYLRRGKLNIIVDNLIAHHRVRPFAMAFVQNGGAARSPEYTCSESTIGFLFEGVIALAQEHLTLTPPGGEPYGVMGASLGGLMALFTGLRVPHVFGKVLSQSGAFGIPEYQYVVTDLVRYLPPPEINIWMDAGRLEWLLEGNREMVALMQDKKYKTIYHEYSGGHNYTSWRNDVWRGLEALFK